MPPRHVKAKAVGSGIPISFPGKSSIDTGIGVLGGGMVQSLRGVYEGNTPPIGGAIKAAIASIPHDQGQNDIAIRYGPVQTRARLPRWLAAARSLNLNYAYSYEGAPTDVPALSF